MLVVSGDPNCVFCTHFSADHERKGVNFIRWKVNESMIRDSSAIVVVVSLYAEMFTWWCVLNSVGFFSQKLWKTKFVVRSFSHAIKKCGGQNLRSKIWNGTSACNFPSGQTTHMYCHRCIHLRSKQLLCAKRFFLLTSFFFYQWFWMQILKKKICSSFALFQ